jgi:23S rRNA pseudouridine1911/1915/1917 synthase
MSQIKSIRITPEFANQRIDKFISFISPLPIARPIHRMGAPRSNGIPASLQGRGEGRLSRSHIQRLINEGRVTVSGKTVKSSYKLKNGDEIKIEIPPLSPLFIKGVVVVKPEPIPLDIIYEDDLVIVVNKPAGMVVHPASGNYSGTLVNALLYHCINPPFYKGGRGGLSGIGGVERPGIVHRLDKDTSGLLMVAKDDWTHWHLSRQLKEKTVVRKYIALVKGNIRDNSGRIEMPIGRHISDRKKMSTKTRKGRTAITEFNVIERFGDYTLLEARLKTGRTHQIRVHLSSIGYPVAGDRVYGRGKVGQGLSLAKATLKGCPTIPRQMLHAQTLGFIHPKTEKYLEFTSTIPDDMKKILDYLKGRI